MSDARSLTTLSEADYDSIAAAVMETTRGRWFLSEYARRNRRSDTDTVLAAISRLEDVVDTALAPLQQSQHDLAQVLPARDMRTGLETGSGEAPSTAHPAKRIKTAAENITTAAENIQEAAWTLRESGADPELCDRLDRGATDIYTTTAAIEALAQQFAGAATARTVPATAEADDAGYSKLPAASSIVTPIDDIDIVEIDGAAHPLADASIGAAHALPSYRRVNSAQMVEEDLIFTDLEDVAPPPQASPAAPAGSSEADLRAIGMLPVEERLRFFA